MAAELNSRDSSAAVLCQVLIPLDLRSGDASKIGPCLESPIPLDDPVEGLAQWKHWLPIQAGPCLGSIQLEKVSFGWVHCGIMNPIGVVSPRPSHFVCNPRHRLGICVDWSKIPSRSKSRGLLCESLHEHEIAAQRFQYELPWSDSGRVSDQAGLTCEKRPHEIGDELVTGPIAAADCIPCPSARQTY